MKIQSLLLYLSFIYLYVSIRLGSSQSGGNNFSLQLVRGTSTDLISVLEQRETIDAHANLGLVVIHTHKVKTRTGLVVMCWCVPVCCSPTMTKHWEAELEALKGNNAKLTAALLESTANVKQWKQQLAAYQEEAERLHKRVMLYLFRVQAKM